MINVSSKLKLAEQHKKWHDQEIFKEQYHRDYNLNESAAEKAKLFFYDELNNDFASDILIPKNKLLTNEVSFGMDSGTCSIGAAFAHSEAGSILPLLFAKDNDELQETMPSIFKVYEDGSIKVGYEATLNEDEKPGVIIYEIKRYYGLAPTSEDFKVITKNFKNCDFVYKGNNVAIVPILNGRALPAISTTRAMGLYYEYAAKIFNILTGNVAKRISLTYPVQFSSERQLALKRAAGLAGLSVINPINEPVSAATYIIYQLLRFQNRQMNEQQKNGESNINESLKKKSDTKKYKGGSGGNTKRLLVFDAGGGTLDVTVLIKYPEQIIVSGADGDPYVAGSKITENVMKFLEEKMNDDKVNIPLNESLQYREFRKKLKAVAEAAKIDLSENDETYIEMVINEETKERWNYKLAVEQFNEINKDAFDVFKQKIINAIKVAHKKGDLGVNPNKLIDYKSVIDECYVIGGTTKIPAVIALLTDIIGENKIQKYVDPMGSVGKGAAVMVAAADRNFKKNNKNIMNKIHRTDIQLMALGTEVVGGHFSEIIPANRHIPCKETRTYITAEDDQTKMAIPVYEGVNTVAKDNSLLGEMIIEDMPPKPKGTLNVKVTFEIDEDGSISATAEIEEENRKQHLKINRGCLNENAGNKDTDSNGAVVLSSRLQKIVNYSYLQLKKMIQDFAIDEFFNLAVPFSIISVLYFTFTYLQPTYLELQKNGLYQNFNIINLPMEPWFYFYITMGYTLWALRLGRCKKVKLEKLDMMEKCLELYLRNKNNKEVLLLNSFLNNGDNRKQIVKCKIENNTTDCKDDVNDMIEDEETENIGDGNKIPVNERVNLNLNNNNSNDETANTETANTETANTETANTETANTETANTKTANTKHSRKNVKVCRKKS